MCGTIRKSEDAKQAIEYALAYADSYKGLDDPDDQLIVLATEFINNYTPLAQQAETFELLARRKDLKSKVSYWDHVIY